MQAAPAPQPAAPRMPNVADFPPVVQAELNARDMGARDNDRERLHMRTRKIVVRWVFLSASLLA